MKAPLSTMAKATSLVFFAGQVVLVCLPLPPATLGSTGAAIQVRLNTSSALTLRPTTNSDEFRGESSATSWRLFPNSHLQSAFNSLSSKIKSEMMFSSTLQTLNDSPSNRALIELGADVVPFLLKDLKENPLDPFPWFETLTEITGHDPTTDASRGNWQAMAQAWIAWGQGNGVLARS